MRENSNKYRTIKSKELTKRKYELIGLCLLFIFSISLWISPFLVVQGDSYRITEYYTVKNGDTLWSIAENIDANLDLREVVYDIMQCNDMQDSSICVDDVIRIPIYN